jgi:hypothetical protein
MQVRPSRLRQKMGLGAGAPVGRCSHSRAVAIRPAGHSQDACEVLLGYRKSRLIVFNAGDSSPSSLSSTLWSTCRLATRCRTSPCRCQMP